MSKKLKVIIVDDEPLARKGLQIPLKAHEDIEVVAECENGKAALSAIIRHDPQVVFLDIQMPGIDGVDLVKSLQGDHTPLIIFVTAYNQYTLEAFEVYATDYILKPVDPKRLAETLDRCKKRLSKHPESVLQIVDGRSLFRFKYEDIYRIESAGDYVCVHTDTGQSIIRARLKNLESELPSEQFLRIHRSNIINLTYIRTISPLTNGEYQIAFQNGVTIRTGRKYKQAVKQLMLQG